MKGRGCNALGHGGLRDNVNGNWLSVAQGERGRGFCNPIDGVAGRIFIEGRKSFRGREKFTE